MNRTKDYSLARIRLAPEDRWVACGAREFGPVGDTRHVVRRGGLTTACGASASTPDIWKANTKKPRCARCLEALVRSRRNDGVR